MSVENAKLGRGSAGFGMAAAITILFSTVLACVKDAYKPLNSFMNSVAWHNWITHGIVDVILFVGLGLILSKSELAERIAAGRLISFLVGAVVVAGLGLFIWYAIF
jgi:hypothetical protein|nr:hypothetical protein [Candidatus Acidoferrales bacterium]